MNIVVQAPRVRNGRPVTSELVTRYIDDGGGLPILVILSNWSERPHQYRSQDTYRQVTGRPAWSGGASSVPKRRVYVYESDELPGILAHELCHIYYDGFYLDGRPDPLLDVW